MAQPARPLRADAARNRARVLEVAYETFAAEGLSVPIDEIARRAGVGAGTVYRHFPTKEALFQRGHRRTGCSASSTTGTRCWNPPGRVKRSSAFCGRWCCSGARRTAAWSRRWPDSASTSPRPRQTPRTHSWPCSATLLRAAQKAGTARRDIGVREVKSILVGCQAMEAYNYALAERVTDVVVDGLRAPR